MSAPRRRMGIIRVRMKRATALGPLGAAALATAASCHAPMDIFSNASDSAARVSHLAWFMIIAAGVIYVFVIAAMLVASARNRDRAPTEVDLTEHGTGWIIFGGAVMPAAVLLVVFVVSMGAMARYPAGEPRLTIRLEGLQWWWSATYEIAGQARFRTANEIHVPVGTTVRFLVTSGDVIHSFWVPRLQGKVDLIPGDTNELRILARRPGVYRGQCAEFCGVQHARMGVVVVADDSATFHRWVERQAADANAPRDSIARAGQRLVVGGPCAACHTIRGTRAAGTVAPDLTHVGSRSTLAAGTVPNTFGNLEGWIANPQAIKPGARMPTLAQYDGRELRAIARYLEGLK